MGVGAYCQKLVSPDSASHLPAPLRWLVAGVVISMILLVALPVAMLIGHQSVTATIARQSPGVGAAQLRWVFPLVMAYSIGLHLVAIALLVWMTTRVLKGRNWARIALSCYLVLATAASIYSASFGGMFVLIVILTDVLHAIMLVLLWLPRSTRVFFAGGRGRVRAGSRTPSRW